MDKAARLGLILSDFRSKAPFDTLDAARRGLEESINEIEDVHSGCEYDPARWRSDGRLYPPEDDFERACSIKGARMFATAGHNVVFGENGAVRIVRRHDGSSVLDLKGIDGEALPS